MPQVLEADASGTPAYMAPEQFGGKGPSVQQRHLRARARRSTSSTPANAPSPRRRSPSCARSKAAGAAGRAVRVHQGHGPVGRARDPARHRARPARASRLGGAGRGGAPGRQPARGGAARRRDAVSGDGGGVRHERRPRCARRVGCCSRSSLPEPSPQSAVSSRALIWSRPPDKSPEVLAEHAREMLARLGYRSRRSIAHRGSKSISNSCDTFRRTIPRGRAGTTATRASCASGTVRARSRSRPGASRFSTETFRESARSTRRSR